MTASVLKQNRKQENNTDQPKTDQLISSPSHFFSHDYSTFNCVCVRACVRACVRVCVCVSPFNCRLIVLSPDKGDYPENSHVLFCPVDDDDVELQVLGCRLT